MITQATPSVGVQQSQSIIIYPTFGYFDREERRWKIPVSGAMYDVGELNLRKRMMIRLLRRAMNVGPEIDQNVFFQQRIRCFAANMLGGQRVSVGIANQHIRLRKRSKRNGQFRGVMRITREQMRRWRARSEHEDWLVLTAHSPCCSAVFEGRARMIEGRGVSVISDIDDTMKHTDVSSKRALLKNTFLREFRSIDGMANLYDAWSSQGAVFHYVSSSPWQLFDPLADLCDTAGFPEGTFHLRSFRLREHMIRRLLLLRRPRKVSVIRRLIKTFPQRRFVLVGDSGEHDPELYGHVARRYPDQVAAIYVRELAARPLDELRFEKAFRGVAPALVKTFHSADELPAQLPLGPTI